MNKFVYFMAVGLAFTALQVATVSADTAAGLVTGGGPPADCGGVPCPTGDDTHPCAAMTGDALIACTAENPPPSGPHAGMAPVLTIGDPLCVVAPALRDPGCPNAMPGTSATMAPPALNMPPPTMVPPTMVPPTMAPPTMAAPPMRVPAVTGTPGMEHHDGPPPGDDCANKPTPEETAACWDQQGGHMDHPGDHPPGDHPPGEHHDDGPPPMDPRTGQPFTKADEVKFQKYADECEATQGLISQGSKDELIAEGFTAIMVDDLCKNGPQDAPPAP